MTMCFYIDEDAKCVNFICNVEFIKLLNVLFCSIYCTHLAVHEYNMTESITLKMFTFAACNVNQGKAMFNIRLKKVIFNVTLAILYLFYYTKCLCCSSHIIS